MVVCFNDQVNPFLNSNHCMALDAANAPNCNEFSNNIGTLSVLLLDIKKLKLHFEDFNGNVMSHKEGLK